MHYPSTKYTPRSGAFRKVKYALPVYDEGEISKESEEEVAKIARQIRDEEDTTQRKLMMLLAAEPVGSGYPKAKRRKSSTSKPSVAKNLFKQKVRKEPLKTPQPEPVTSVVDEEVYNKLYPENATLPSFPVVSSADPMCGEAEEPESDYDMDTDDEEWLNSNPDLHITSSRLEYLFTQLNKRNTHVKTTAMWGLRPPYLEDFHKVFPYWKEKRLQNTNVSTWRPQKTFRKENRIGGYVSTDPFLVFQSKGCKTQTQVKSTKKYYPKEQIEAMVDRTLAIRKRILNIRSWAHDEVLAGEETRDHLVQVYSTLNERYTQKSSQESSQIPCSQPRPDSPVVDANNNEAAVQQYTSAEQKPDTPKSISCERRTSISPSCSALQSAFPSMSHPEEKKKSKDLAFDDILRGRWKKIVKQSRRNHLKENKPASGLKYSCARQKSQGIKGMRNAMLSGDWNTTLNV
ncbi:Enhancer of polycomb 2 [Orchesella cincta]|uniref:Enhancer of polycomb 2 n=1 Tax=Orchesella cincta TaxID=48709 RepID=A0A1D2MRA6_ORCCI|nr:Enhancer of polycomb 2 [Orchesella cincta]